MSEKLEVDIVYDIITHPAGYDIGCAGILSIRQYEYPVWAVEWEEYHTDNFVEPNEDEI